MKQNFQDEGVVVDKRDGFDPHDYDCDTSHDSTDFLGKGSFGTVYKAHLSSTAESSDTQAPEVAMKVIKLSDDDATRKYQKKGNRILQPHL